MTPRKPTRLNRASHERATVAFGATLDALRALADDVEDHECHIDEAITGHACRDCCLAEETEGLIWMLSWHISILDGNLICFDGKKKARKSVGTFLHDLIGDNDDDAPSVEEDEPMVITSKGGLR